MLLLSTKSISSGAGKSGTEHSSSVLQVARVGETVLRLVERLLDLFVLLELGVGFLEVALLEEEGACVDYQEQLGDYYLVGWAGFVEGKGRGLGGCDVLDEVERELRSSGFI